jgi:outer membrane protein TolC
VEPSQHSVSLLTFAKFEANPQTVSLDQVVARPLLGAIRLKPDRFLTKRLLESTMFGRGCRSIHDGFGRRVAVAVVVLILLPAVASAQESRSAVLKLSVPAAIRFSSEGPADMRRITLKEAQQLAQAASDPLKRLGELQVEAARQHRLGVRSMYFPGVATQFVNLHLSAEPGELLSFQRPLTGALINVPVQVFFQDQTLVNVVATQPITQLLAIRQLVKIARADENIARAKAGMPVEAVTRRVEKNYFDLLVAQRELAAATADARELRTGWATVGDAGAVALSTQQADALRANTATALMAGKVATLTASLNGLLGFPSDSRLELVPPAPLFENLTLTNALAQAQTAPPLEVIEAEQTAAKAHAAAKIAKLEYVPGVAVLGGYLHQDVIASTVLPESFGYVGVLATWTIFDGLKREHGVKEAAANEEAADLGVRLAKEKAAAAVKSAYFELERSRDAYYLARTMLSTREGVSFVSNHSDAASSRARAEADVFRAEMAYRDAYATLTTLISGK